LLLGFAWVGCDVKPGPVIKLPLIVKWKANLTKSNIPKWKLDNLAIECRNSTEISKTQKNTKPPTENQS
jgi:hypothetical protein